MIFSNWASNAYFLDEETFERVDFWKGSGPILVRTTRQPLQMNWYSLRNVRVRGGEDGDDSV